MEALDLRNGSGTSAKWSKLVRLRYLNNMCLFCLGLPCLLPKLHENRVIGTAFDPGSKWE